MNIKFTRQMKLQKTFKKNQGFTIVELMIATTIFSFILIVASSGVVAIGRMYFKGITSAKTQEVARNIMEEISRARQFSGQNKTFAAAPPGGYDVLCFGENRYTFKINQKVDDNPANVGLYYTTRSLSEPLCLPETNGGEEMLARNMRLLDLRAEPIGGENIGGETIGAKNFRIVVKVAYGDNDLLSIYDPGASDTDPPIFGAVISDAYCRSGVAGGSFCSVSELATIVNKRI